MKAPCNSPRIILLCQGCSILFHLIGKRLGFSSNVRQDPHETTDLSAAMPGMLATMKKRLVELAATALNQDDFLYYAGRCEIMIVLNGS